MASELSDKTKKRRVKARVEEHMQFCRQYPANTDSSEGMSSALEFETSLVVTDSVPLEQGITVCTESHPHHDHVQVLYLNMNYFMGILCFMNTLPV